MELSDRLSQGLRLEKYNILHSFYQMIPGGSRPGNYSNEKGIKEATTPAPGFLPLLGQNPCPFGTHVSALQNQKETVNTIELRLHLLLFRNGTAEFLRVSCLAQPVNDAR